MRLCNLIGYFFSLSYILYFQLTAATTSQTTRAINDDNETIKLLCKIAALEERIKCDDESNVKLEQLLEKEKEKNNKMQRALTDMRVKNEVEKRRASIEKRIGQHVESSIIIDDDDDLKVVIPRSVYQ